MPESKRRKTKKSTRPRVVAPSAVAVAKAKGPSPTWYVVVMAGLMGVGVLAVISRFVFFQTALDSGIGGSRPYDVRGAGLPAASVMTAKLIAQNYFR